MTGFTGYRSAGHDVTRWFAYHNGGADRSTGMAQCTARGIAVCRVIHRPAACKSAGAGVCTGMAGSTFQFRGNVGSDRY